jgi:hypothetical protein
VEQAASKGTLARGLKRKVETMDGPTLWALFETTASSGDEKET